LSLVAILGASAGHAAPPPTTFASGFNGPVGLAFDSAGDLFIANAFGNTVSEIAEAAPPPPPPVPTLSEWAMILLGASLGGWGLLSLRRRAHGR
jgi:hypothetical protein